jgi:hypothetical protein
MKIARKTLAYLFDRAWERRIAFEADCVKLGVDCSRVAASIYRAGEPESNLPTKRKRNSRKRPPMTGYDFSSGRDRSTLKPRLETEDPRISF